ncbi:MULTISPECIES: helix-turn-helix domain-containing protein [unclassified Streptomyces]|uniref:helix-turn-helix domain-containing protein n=1 Tax=unclassified Streptomyces TaxID=2593676 RepID=UPI0034478097
MTTTTSPGTTVSERRAQAAALSRDGASLRTIAQQLGVSKDTIKRDLDALARERTRQSATQDATSDETSSATPATPATACETPASLSPGDPLTVTVDQELLDDLAVITRTGRSPADAIGHAVHTLAAIYRGAWTTGAYPIGTEPDVIGHQLKPYRG